MNNMKKRIVWVVLGLLVVGVATGYFLFRADVTAQHEIKETLARILSGTEPLEMPSSGLSTSDGTPESVAEIEDEIYTMFDVDKRGNLVLNAGTRINIEKLTALNTPEELKEKLRKFSVVLPPEAYRQLVYLIEDFKGYIAAVKGAYPPDAEIETVEEALDEMEGIHALRVKYFGAKVAEAFFAEEDKLNRQLLQLMALEADENMTMEEKAHKAQQLIESSPELSTANDPDRN
jgi:hypothetical protein